MMRIFKNKRNTNKIIVVIANYDFSENAEFLKDEFQKYLPTIIIDCGSSNPPKSVDMVILNTFYPGLWNASTKFALENDYEWLLFIASDIEIADVGRLIPYLSEAINLEGLGVYSPSLEISSRCSFDLQYNRNTSGIRKVGIVEGFCFLSRVSLLKQLYPIPASNIYGWGVDISMCNLAYEQDYAVVCDDRIRVKHPKKKEAHSIDEGAALEMSIEMLGAEKLNWVSEIQTLYKEKIQFCAKTKTLDLGCGPYLQNEFQADEIFGVDLEIQNNRRILQKNLATGQIPFRKNTFDYVTAYDFIEHIPRSIYRLRTKYSFVDLMDEVWRVLKPGGIFLSLTPAYPSPKAFQDPTHVNYITEETFPSYFCTPNLWARMYGFKGDFEIISQDWDDGKLRTLLRAIK